MTLARAAALGVALAVVMCPAAAVTQTAPPLWLAPTGKPSAASAAFATAANWTPAR